MNGEWTPGRLADFADVLMGTSPPGETTNETGMGTPLLNGPTEFTSHAPVAVQYTTSPVKLCEPGDILFCVRGSTTGRMNWADRQYAIGRGLAAIRHRNGNKYQPYVRAVIEYALPSLLAVSTGSTFPSVSRTDIENVKVAIPPLREQQAIACSLGALDDKIELNRRRNRTLEAMARAIFQSWFVDFDPVKAKAAGRTPPGLSPELAALFPDRFEDSPLGPIPAGWRVGNLGEVAKNPRRGIGAEAIKSGTPYIALEHMPRRSIALSDWTTADAIESNKFEFRRGEILFGKLRPYFHKVGIAPVDGVCSTDILVIVPKQPEWFGFCAEHFSSDAIIQHCDRTSTGTKMPRTNWNDLARFVVAIPQREVAEAFTKQFKPIIDRIHQGIQESRTLAALRDALLPKLISGELRVPDAERIVGRIL